MTNQNDNTVLARTPIDSFRTEVSTRGHELVADEPRAAGGSDKGPTPYDLLSAALATCTSMTLKMYAGRKNMALRRISVSVSHGKVHADDCHDCDTRDGHVDEFQRVIAFDGDLTDAEIERLLQIADKCPVHRTLHGEIKVRTRHQESIS